MLLPALLCCILAAPSAATVPDGKFNFDLLDTPAAPAPADPRLDAQLIKRRRMLQIHQVAGLSTLAVMATTVVLGQLNYHDMYTQGGGHSGRFAPYHQGFAYATTGAFIATASLSLFAPTPLEKRRGRFDTATAHKISVAVASAGMVSQIALGFITARQADAGNGRHLPGIIKAHQVLGYTTLGALSFAAVVWVF